MPSRLSTDAFIKKARKLHNNRYDYSKVVYVNMNTVITIICLYHGEFQQTPREHLYSASGCKYCTYKYSLGAFVSKCTEIHQSKYTYNIKNLVNLNDRINIVCSIHGNFTQLAFMHLRGHGCQKCADINRRLTKNQFVTRANAIHNNHYSYENLIYETTSAKGTITCFKHGDFSQLLTNHLAGSGCPKCRRYTSKSENIIETYLQRNHIHYHKHFAFEDCVNTKTGYRLYFDFYLPKLNVCIEYNGEQHYKPINLFGRGLDINSFCTQQNRDMIKFDYCKTNNIKLIIIPYTHQRCVKAILAIELSNFYVKEPFLLSYTGTLDEAPLRHAFDVFS